MHAPQSIDQTSHLDTHSQYPDQSFSQQYPTGQASFNQSQSFPQNEVQQQPVFFNPALPLSQPMSLPPSFPPASQQPPERRPSQPWENDFNRQEQMSSSLGIEIIRDDFIRRCFRFHSCNEKFYLFLGYPQHQPDPYKNVASNNNEYIESNENIPMNNRYDQPEVLDNEQSYNWDTSQQTITMPSKSKFTYFNSEEDKKSVSNVINSRYAG